MGRCRDHRTGCLSWRVVDSATLPSRGSCNLISTRERGMRFDPVELNRLCMEAISVLRLRNNDLGETRSPWVRHSRTGPTLLINGMIPRIDIETTRADARSRARVAARRRKQFRRGERLKRSCGFSTRARSGTCCHRAIRTKNRTSALSNFVLRRILIEVQRPSRQRRAGRRRVLHRRDLRHGYRRQRTLLRHPQPRCGRAARCIEQAQAAPCAPDVYHVKGRVLLRPHS